MKKLVALAFVLTAGLCVLGCGSGGEQGSAQSGAAEADAAVEQTKLYTTDEVYEVIKKLTSSDSYAENVTQVLQTDDTIAVYYFFDGMGDEARQNSSLWRTTVASMNASVEALYEEYKGNTVDELHYMYVIQDGFDESGNLVYLYANVDGVVLVDIGAGIDERQ